jgi:hypothetical protein
MTPVSGSSDFFQNDLRALYLYGPHILLAAVAAAFMDTAILWETLPKTLLLFGIVCYSGLSFYALFLIARAGHVPTLKIRKTCRLLLLLSLLLALCWGSCVLLITNGTLLVYARHSLFLFCICGLFSIYLAALPIMAYCFLAIGLAPILFILFFKAPACMNTLAYSLRALTLLQVIIFFYSKTLRTSTRRCHHTQLPPHKLGIRLQRSYLARS